LHYLVKGLHLWQGQCNVPGATHDDDSVEIPDRISRRKHF